ncbi:MAG: M23 family metallopeptidase [Treponema sp.]|nr:M23 family metallopeptidase [Treponema sp.]
MVSIIENQRVSKRRQTSRTRHNNKSAGFNSEFMNQFRQKPISHKKIKGRPKPLFNSPKPVLRPLFTAIKGFKITLSSIATAALIAGTIIFAIAALNWEEFSIKMPEFHLSDNTSAEQQTIQYAATGISSILPPINIQEEQTPPDVKTDDPHGILVAFEWRQHRVQRGESVSVIAQKFGVSIGAVIASNEIRNARRLQEGAVLRIPNIDGIPYQIKKGDSLSRIAASFNVPLEVILDVNDIKSDVIKAGETIFIPGARMNDIDLRLSLGDLFMYPLHSRFITSYYGIRKDPKTGILQHHTGVDFRANTGTTVMATLDGVVEVVAENWLYGKYIIISHGNGYKTLYAHLNSFNVKEKDRVARGRKIGEVGNTGYSTGPHLHFEIWDRNNRRVNPLELLN